MAKYYAVKRGRKTGIYDNWESAKRQIWGFQKAVHKSFDNLESAREFLGDKKANVIKDTRTEVVTYNKSDELIEPIHYGLPERDKPKNIYRLGAVISGSGDKKKGYYTFGSVMFENEQIVQKIAHGGNVKKYAQNYNITGEILGTIKTIEYAIEKGYKEVCIYYSLEGIDKWATGIWNPRLPITKFYRRKIKEYQNKITLDFKSIGHYPELPELKEYQRIGKSVSYKALKHMLSNKK